MTTLPHPLPPRPRAMAIAAGFYAMLGGGVTLVGWALEMPRLTNWFGGDITMKANTAICAVLVGTALLLATVGGGSRFIFKMLAIVMMAIAALTLAEHITGWNPGIDTLLFTEPPGEPGAISP